MELWHTAASTAIPLLDRGCQCPRAGAFILATTDAELTRADCVPPSCLHGHELQRWWALSSRASGSVSNPTSYLPHLREVHAAAAAAVREEGRRPLQDLLRLRHRRGPVSLRTLRFVPLARHPEISSGCGQSQGRWLTGAFLPLSKVCTKSLRLSGVPLCHHRRDQNLQSLTHGICSCAQAPVLLFHSQLLCHLSNLLCGIVSLTRPVGPVALLQLHWAKWPKIGARARWCDQLIALVQQLVDGPWSFKAVYAQAGHLAFVSMLGPGAQMR